MKSVGDIGIAVGSRRCQKEMGFCNILWPCQTPPARWRSCRSYSTELLERGAALASPSPVDALRSGSWVKLICGASMDDVPLVRTLAEVYTIAGVDCIDCAADPAVVRAVVQGVDAASDELGRHGLERSRPYVMVSINDGEDPHFRKAFFDPEACPADCPRPCERVCPTTAISAAAGVSDERCYGCGRCIPSCPYDLIEARSYVRSPESVAEVLRKYPVDALEIHTLPGHDAEFRELWTAVNRWVNVHLRLLAVSMPDSEDLAGDIEARYAALGYQLGPDLVWQTDGRPMSGDIGRGTAFASVRLAAKVLDCLSERHIPGFVQLAGGTNDATANLLHRHNLLGRVAGVAFGGYARKSTTLALERSADDALISALNLIAAYKATNHLTPG